MSDVTPQGVDPLRLSACPDCGYSLDGLPDTGLCPECGRGYDQEVVVLFGWAKGQRASVVDAAPLTTALMLAVQLAIPLFLLIVAWHRPIPRLMYLWMVLPLAASGYPLWKRWSSTMPAPVQVHLSAHGCLQLDRLSTFARRPTRWDRIDCVRLVAKSPARYRLTLTRRVAWWAPESRSRVDALLKCTDDRATAIRQRIDAWRTAAAAAKPTGGFPVVQKS